MKCPVCNSLNDQGARYCAYCGANLTVTTTFISKESLVQAEYNPRTVYAKPAMILGIISLVFGVICCMGPISIVLSIIPGILAIIFSILSLKTKERGKAVAGLICGIIGLFLGLLLLGITLLFINPAFLEYLRENYPEFWQAIQDAMEQFQ